LPLDKHQIDLLIEAAQADWRHVEPAIFGTLLERALDPHERHKLGAHYTPRAYVERLVMPTVIEPLRDEWTAAQAAALTLDRQGKRQKAIDEIRKFHDRLCHVRVLDPACGSGNFLYVTLEHLKRLEGEVLNTLDELGETQGMLEMAGATVDPHQMLGIETNPRAAHIAEAVLWIGYLQWHFRTRGNVSPPEPVLKDFHNIENRDAVLAWDRVEFVTGDDGRPVTRWDGRTMKQHPVTGEDVPDETARIPTERYINPRKAGWPDADFVVGNPPFIGNKRMRLALGDGYVGALRETYPRVPESADFVMYWWHHAADLTREGKLKRFGLITTNSLRQAFNRRVIEFHMAQKKPLSLVFAVPDHPWVDGADGAAVRIAMSVGEGGTLRGQLGEFRGKSEDQTSEQEVHLLITSGKISPDISVGTDTTKLLPLSSNIGLACPGVQLSGQGFILSPSDLEKLSERTRSALVRRYVTGRDLSQKATIRFVFDTANLTEDELRKQYPDAFQWLKDRVWPERQHNPRQTYRERWWIHAEPRSKFRKSLRELETFVATSRTARHRVFQRLPTSYLPETKVLIVALDNLFHVGVLSSKIHVSFAMRTGGWLGVGNDSTYNHSVCFDAFPFPDPTEPQRTRIADLAEQLDAHRKARQAAHPGLTLTAMYNVLDKLRARDGLHLSPVATA
ncbi:MAG: class I SAM-dependent DNA methyltransferase, partial [Gammaproteobacteria bacterium]|nr:class I SAM-dependent DNA methyltransferase [Gammaproteobacteria bacterium]